MTMRVASLSGALALSMFMPIPSTVAAGDFGILGQTWDIAEPDFLLTINAKLKGLEASGELDRLNQQMVKRTKHRVRNPHPVTGLAVTTKPKSWLHDPSIVVAKDILDHKGRVIAAKGAKANPLENLQFNRKMVFIQGKSKEQIDWAVKRYGDFNSRIIFVDGSPFDEMKARKHKFYFDQRGFLIKKFGISQVPAIIEGEGKLLRIREVLPPQTKKKAGKA